jgi:hypothetical protein
MVRKKIFGGWVLVFLHGGTSIFGRGSEHFCTQVKTSFLDALTAIFAVIFSVFFLYSPSLKPIFSGAILY